MKIIKELITKTFTQNKVSKNTSPPLKKITSQYIDSIQKFILRYSGENLALRMIQQI